MYKVIFGSIVYNSNILEITELTVHRGLVDGLPCISRKNKEDLYKLTYSDFLAILLSEKCKVQERLYCVLLFV